MPQLGFSGQAQNSKVGEKHDKYAMMTMKKGAGKKRGLNCFPALCLNTNF